MSGSLLQSNGSKSRKQNHRSQQVTYNLQIFLGTSENPRKKSIKERTPETQNHLIEVTCLDRYKPSLPEMPTRPSLLWQFQHLEIKLQGGESIQKKFE